MKSAVYLRDGSRCLARPAPEKTNIPIRSQITAIKNGRKYMGQLFYVVESYRQADGSAYLEFRCDTFSCLEREIESWTEA